MNDLPNPPQAGNLKSQISNLKSDGIQSGTTSQPDNFPRSGDKEKEVISAGGLEAPALREVGKEAVLPAEAAAVGVKLHPTTVTVPQPVARLGVKSVGDTSMSQGAPAVALPLNDEQIAKGLHQSITSSWRWLAQWCIRRLRQLHLALKKIHGKVLRVKTK